jgi:hypothetical protein
VPRPPPTSTERSPSLGRFPGRAGPCPRTRCVLFAQLADVAQPARPAYPAPATLTHGRRRRPFSHPTTKVARPYRPFNHITTTFQGGRRFKRRRLEIQGGSAPLTGRTRFADLLKGAPPSMAPRLRRLGLHASQRRAPSHGVPGARQSSRVRVPTGPRARSGVTRSALHGSALWRRPSMAGRVAGVAPCVPLWFSCAPGRPTRRAAKHSGRGIHAPPPPRSGTAPAIKALSDAGGPARKPRRF